MQPRLLSCGHTMCKKCLEVYFVGKMRDCPTCRLIVITVLDISEYPINEELVKLIPMSRMKEHNTNDNTIHIACCPSNL